MLVVGMKWLFHWWEPDGKCRLERGGGGLNRVHSEKGQERTVSISCFLAFLAFPSAAAPSLPNRGAWRESCNVFFLHVASPQSVGQQKYYRDIFTPGCQVCLSSP